MQLEQEGRGKVGADNLNGFPRGGVNQREALGGGLLEGNRTIGFCSVSLR